MTDNAKTTLRLFEEFNREGVEAILRRSHPDCVWHAAPTWPGKPVYRGAEGARELVSEWTDSFDDYSWQPERVLGEGENVVALAQHGGRSRSLRAWLEHPVAAVFRFREGRIAAARFFFSWDEALEAAGPQNSRDSGRGAGSSKNHS